ncbi:PAS domain S-box protein [Paucibacter sp. R3-3]|uniref:histidine kinase n=1 Tax=Roseateles agri TaxID=3098619 RepID=A0ABU5DPS5_9BURK|nr:PAS domain S-box protein [Paucibacter sp. R3-3]MDY0747645.1 PAS domain S-box protein [Paucibacter sp. R3-3]
MAPTLYPERRSADERTDASWRLVFERLHEGFILGKLVRGANGSVRDWQYVEVNPAWSKLVGVAQEAAIGRTIREVFPGIEDAWIDDFAEVVATGVSTTFTRQVGTLDRWYEGHAFKVDDERFAVLFLEITERKRQTDAMERLNGELQRLIAERVSERDSLWNTSADILFTLDKTGRLLSVNPAATKILGWAEGEMVGRNVMEFIAPQDLRLTAEALETASRQTLAVIENRYLHKDGGFRWLSWVAAPDGELIFATGRHITAEKTAALAAAKVAADLDRIWQNAHEVIMVIDLDGMMQSVSPASFDILGWLPDELLGRKVTDFIHPDFQPPLRDGRFVPERYVGQKVFLNRFRTKYGSYRTMSWSTRLEGGLIYSHGRDVTIEQEQAAALTKAEAQLRQSQKMEAVGQLTGGVAHDFNNLLASISGALQVLRVRLKQGKTEGLDRYVSMGMASVRRAAALTQRLLAFSRRQTLDPKPTDVNRLISGMEDLVRRTVGPEVLLTVVGAAGLWPATLDAAQLENALLNLCINGRDAMPHGGTLTIETANKWLDDQAADDRELPPGQYISLCVSDNGTGMSPDVAKLIFDPFYTTKPTGEGTGLGLSMVYGFARQSGGAVRVYTELGKGTTMCLYFPRYLGAAEPDTVGCAPPPVEAGAGETVLLVEDEDQIRILASEVLVDAGYRVLAAHDGASALSLLQATTRVDLMITDVGLPGGMNGRQIADAARLQRPDLKVLFITGYAANAAVGNGFLEPGMEVMTKPFEFIALVNKVRQLLDGFR